MQEDKKKQTSKAEGKEAPPVQLTRHQPNTLVALNAPDSAHITLDLCFANPYAQNEANRFVTKSMAREKEEEAQKVLDRIRLLFQPPRTKGGGANPKQKESRVSKEDLLAACPPIRVLGDPSLADENASAAPKGEDSYVALDTSLPQSVFWKCAKVLYIGDLRNTVRYNVPTITSLVPPSTPFVGVPTVCSSVTTLFTAAHELAYEWGVRNSNNGTLTVLSRDPVFTPTEDLLGQSIVLRLAADASSGLWAEVVLAPVKRSPPPVKRWEQTTSFVTAPDLRVVSYNILYEDFCTGKPFCRTRIYPFASDEVLAIDNRKVRILQELLAYHADLIGLQECGKKLFREYLLPSMRSQGYDGVYANKSGTVQEGCGFLYRTERFERVQEDSFPLNWATLERDHEPIASAIAQSHPELKEALENITSIGFLLILKEKATGKEIVAANTHLFYHANACHIRILQAYMLLHAVAHRLRAADGTERPVIICGDCNCTHSTGAYRLFTAGLVEESHRSWDKGKLFYWGCDRQLGYDDEEAAAVAAADVSVPKSDKDDAASTGDAAAAAAGPRPPLTECFHKSLYAPFRMTDSYDRMDPGMPWTNFTMTFREVIDYIFFSDSSLDVIRTIPIPDEAELAENYALPNAKYPSDHVALIADLRIKK